MKKIILNIIFVVYVIIAVLVTICLLSYNNFKTTQFGDYSLIIITDNELAPEYKNGDLVIVNKKDKISVGEKAFFYSTYDNKIEIKLGTIVNEEKITREETTYTLEGERKISSEYVLGPSDTTTKIPVMGSVLGVLESKWGFLFLIVLPALLAFLYQITIVVSELRNTKDTEKKDE